MVLYCVDMFISEILAMPATLQTYNSLATAKEKNDFLMNFDKKGRMKNLEWCSTFTNKTTIETSESSSAVRNYYTKSLCKFVCFSV